MIGREGMNVFLKPQIKLRVINNRGGEQKSKRLWQWLASVLIFLGYFPIALGLEAENKDVKISQFSVDLLGELFGKVGSILQGTSGQMLGEIFRHLNTGIILVTGGWLIYTVITICVRSAQEGILSGPNKNVPLICLRISVGFSLLIPGHTGYSPLQFIVMKVVVAGTHLADNVWGAGIDYAQKNGNQVWKPPEVKLKKSDTLSKQASPDSINKILGNQMTNVYGMSQKIFASWVCVNAANAQLAKNDAYTKNQKIEANTIASSDLFHPKTLKINESQHEFEFPSLFDSKGCGNFSWKIEKICQSTSGSTCLEFKNIIQKFIYDLEGAAKNYYCSIEREGYACDLVSLSQLKNVAQDNQAIFLNAFLDFLNGSKRLLQELNQKNHQEETQKFQQFFENTKKEGWLTAGRYYWDLVHIQSPLAETSADIGVLVPEVKKESNDNEEIYNNAIKASWKYVSPVREKYNFIMGLKDPYAQVSKPQEKMFKSKDSSVNILSIFFPVIVHTINLVSMFDTNGVNADPVLFLHKIGSYCFLIAADIWFGMLVPIFLVMAAAGVCNATFDIGKAIKSVLDWIKPLMSMIAVAFWGAGFLLGIYLPMYPYLIFTFATVGWLIMVIEAMVAAPLICLGLTHPEGHDFLGEAKQTLMLLLGVFLRPVLMIVGLIAGMILSYVTFKLVIYTFSSFVSDLFIDSYKNSVGNQAVSVLEGAGYFQKHLADSMKSLGNPVSGFFISLLVTPLIFVIFALIITQITIRSYNLIFVLPDNILRWIGGPQQPSEAGQMAQEIKGTLQSYGDNTSRPMGEMSGKLESKRDEMIEKLKRRRTTLG